MTELCDRPAVELRHLLLAKDVSAREVLDAHLQRIAEVNPTVNAIVTSTAERAMERAQQVDDASARSGEPVGTLHGLPVAHKDLVETRGIRTTYGCAVYADHVPDVDALLVERYRDAGAVLVGKTNTPEFGAGSHTRNAVFGVTANPFDPSRSAGGSSGGAAAALATGMLPIADGSDMGGSLRNPASFCDVVGLRPSYGLVPNWPAATAFFPYVTLGGMGRTAADVALQLQVLAAPDARGPVHMPSAAQFAQPLDRDFTGVVVAVDADLDGLPVDADVAGVFAGVVPELETLGMVVRESTPGWADADDAFLTWRGWYQAFTLGDLVDAHPDEVGPNIRWNVDQGRQVTAADLMRAERQRMAVFHRVREFLTEHEFLVCPVNQVAPFDADLWHPTDVAGEPVRHYLDWMRACSRVTVASLPAASVPFGYTDAGLPVGVQVVGRPGADLEVLRFAHALSARTTRRRPAVLGVAG
ncbi:MAG: amidase [Streptosporangiales bacterium]|nr:amidase [Streptosporangiales bacterium]